MNMILQQIFSIPVEEGKYLVYAPLKRIAFLANAALVNAIVEKCREGEGSLSGNTQAPARSEDGPQSFMDFLRSLNFFQPDPVPGDACQAKRAEYDALILFLTNQFLCPPYALKTAGSGAEFQFLRGKGIL